MALKRFTLGGNAPFFFKGLAAASRIGIPNHFGPMPKTTMLFEMAFFTTELVLVFTGSRLSLGYFNNCQLLCLLSHVCLNGRWSRIECCLPWLINTTQSVTRKSHLTNLLMISAPITAGFGRPSISPNACPDDRMSWRELYRKNTYLSRL